MDSNVMNDEEFGSRKLLKLKYRTRNQITHFLKNWFPPEIRSSLFILQKYQDSEKITPESWRMQWTLINHAQIVSIKLWKLTYRRVDQIIQTFCKIGTLQKLGPHLEFVEIWRFCEKYSWVIENVLKGN